MTDRLTHPDMIHYTRYERDLDCDCAMLLRDAKDIADLAGDYTVEQETIIFETIAILQCAIRKI
jgi:hypothetical protein